MVRKQVSLSQAIEGYFIAAQARRLSPAMLAEYGYTFQHFTRFFVEDPLLAEITPADIRAFLNSRDGVSRKTLANNRTGLSALWTWAVEQGLVEQHVVREVRRPKPERREIMPYSEAHVRAMLAACERSRPYRRPGKAKCDHARPPALRDRPILLLLVDTGVRVTEPWETRIYQVDLRNRRVTVLGNGSKERMVPISARTAQAVWRYLAERGETRKAEVLFPGRDDLPMSRYGMRRLVKRIGDWAGVYGATVHRFRHTFAIELLQNQPNVFALQRMLGHSSLEMVKRYLAIAQADVEVAHQEGSPVADWAL